MIIAFIPTYTTRQVHLTFCFLQRLEPAIMEFSVKSSLVIEPDGVYMLEGARVPMKLMESIKTKEGIIKKGK